MRSATQTKSRGLAKFAIPAIVIAAIIITAAITGGIFFTMKDFISFHRQWDESEFGDYPFNPHLP
ncbi:MAG: hypothetical protein UV40_C0021G0014 [Parcubacteria group bacterium GW2011_GWA1_42_7]|nr:MAG: hypothetical protein UV34_C0041G0007 [Parcubacteria group bacterium GW2011_GWB1_42_6]KKS69513.1 MAG: hypothetical protein UV40_C0021G0014 [Parcubacteria group bacterium GW2011_GWA1_42_7]KKS91758.1 MAG: hypothetical protein UV67_C0019G0002 [Parcubacteria group bacterium GW2011_GWC1_43_12]